MSWVVAAAAESIDPNPVALGVGLLLVSLAGVVMAVLWILTRPARPEAGPAVMEGGAEPPAIVDLLTGGFEVEDDAVPATVVDLAARGWVDIEEVAGGNVILRVRTGRGELTRYEERVRRHVERRASNGVAPAAALTIGPEGVSNRWWKGFVREVNRHGRDLGLCRRRWDFLHLAVVWGSLGLAWVALIATAATADRVETTGGWGDPAALLTFGGFAVLALMTWIARRIVGSDAQAETPAGMRAASQWLGVREYLADTGSFEEAPAASVAIWDRQLAYATALGLAPVVQRQLPFETEHDRHAWSHATGRWRRVKVRYVSARPGWGEAPWTVAFAGAVQSALAGAAIWLGVQFAREEFDVSSLPEGLQRWLPAIGAGVAAVAAVTLVWTGAKIALGLSDLLARRTVEGELVRRREFKSGHRLPRMVQWAMWSGTDEHGYSRDQNRRTRYHVAIDDGSSDRIVAFSVRPQLIRAVRQGSRVRARFSPRLGYVTELEETAPPPGTEGPVAHELVEDVADRASGAAAVMSAQLTENIQRMSEMVDEDGLPLLDRVDDEGVSVRQRLEEAQARLRRLGPDDGHSGTRRSDGSPLLAGFMDQIAGVVEGLADTGSRGDESSSDDADRQSGTDADPS